jgi:signal peptidase I
MGQNQHRSRLFDTRAYFYRSIVQLLIIVSAGFFIKFTFFDFFSIRGSQMEPSILNGDRLIVFRTPYLPPFNKWIKPGIGKPVIIRHSSMVPMNCLRIAGISGDTVSVDSGSFINSRVTNPVFAQHQTNEIVPESYSPRDYFHPYRIPNKGDSIILDNSSIRDFFFTLSVIRQENPTKTIKMVPTILIDGLKASDYIISGFTLYKGTVETVPEEFSNDWFFWERLDRYLKQSKEDKNIKLSFCIQMNGSTLNYYKVRSLFAFFLADNWNSGLDSRYFGPVKTENILGRAFFVAWSRGKDNSDKVHLRFNRFGRIVK